MTKAPEPVSWFVIERGWKVQAADGREVGKVEETVGDSERDIFNGLTVATGLLGRPRYVAAEKVAEITAGHVRLALTAEQFEHLDEYEPPPPSKQILPG
jgi:hypothetical protein